MLKRGKLAFENLLLVFLLSGFLMAAGCGGDNGTVTVHQTPDVAGNWDFYYSADGGRADIGPELLEISQDGELIQVARSPVDGPPVSGAGTAAANGVSFDDGRISARGNAEGDSLAGTWTNADGQTGTWSAVRLTGQEPVVLINLGDSLVNGVQSAMVNEFTQVNSFPQVLAEQMDARAFTIWRDPLITADGARIHPEYLPFNLGVSGLDALELISERTGEGNPLLDALLAPIPQLVGGPVSPLEAAEYLAGLYPDKRKIITLWIGNNDVLGAVLRESGTLLNSEAIQAFLNDPAMGHDLPDVTAHLTEIVERLSAIPRAEVLIANIPDVSQVAFLLTPEDLERLAVFPGAEVTALAPGEALGFGPFLNPEAPEQSVARALSTNNALLNAAILGTRAASESFVLTPEEAAPIQERVAALNQLIADLARRPNVHLVDVNGTLERLAAGEITVAGNNLTRTWGGGAFSLDGIHPSNTGYALLANRHVAALNAAMPDLAVPELDLSVVWENDPYRDRDGDGYVYGPEFPPVIEPSLLPLADCDDADPDVWPTYISGMPCP
ncbi:MAG: SGNH/GDSL hydrolase family protein [Desulfococcaceae bacterium]